MPFPPWIPSSPQGVTLYDVVSPLGRPERASRRIARWMVLSHGRRADDAHGRTGARRQAARRPPATAAARPAGQRRRGPGRRLQAATDVADLDAIYRIKEEGLSNSKVMDTLSYLTDVHGPRLTNSPGMRAAAEWAKTQLTEWGLSNVALRDLGPVRTRLGQRALLRPDDRAAGVPAARLPQGLDARHQRPGHGRSRAGLDREGRGPREVEGQAHRQDRAGLADCASARPTSSRRRAASTRRSSTDISKQPSASAARRAASARAGPAASARSATGFRKQRMAFYIKEGVAAMVEMSPGNRGDNGAVVVSGAARGRRLAPGERRRRCCRRSCVAGRALRAAGAAARQEDSGQARARRQEPVRRHRPQQLQRDRRAARLATRPTKS